MNGIRPLWFLFTRQIVNGVKRAVKTPRRLISVLVGLGYYFAVFARPWDSTGNRVFRDVHIEPLWLDGGSFMVFTVLCIFLSMGVFSFRNTFKPADVDVLFPTPISPKVVMGFRLFRDCLTTFMFPFILMIFFYKPWAGLMEAMRRDSPNSVSSLMRGAMLAWVLMAFAWVAISYALSFFVAKHDKQSRAIVNGVGWGIFLAVMTVVGAITYTIQQTPSLETLASITAAPWIRTIMFIPTSATWLMMGLFNGSPSMFALGSGILLATIIGSLWYASSLSGWMYDQAATKGFQSQALRDYQKRGDYSAIAAERARQGKVRNRRITKRMANWTFRKGWALFYKEVLIQVRIGFWLNILFIGFACMFGLIFMAIPGMGNSNLPARLYLAMTGFMAINMSSAQAHNSFVETLRRVEVMKPLPLTSGQIAFFETASKAAVAMTISIVPFIIGMIYRPIYMPYHLAGLIAAPTTALALVSAVFLVVVLFPDFDDPTQRTFRGLMQLLALLLVFGPTVLVFALFFAIDASPVYPALISAGINVGLTFLLTSIAGRFYADFNPSE